MNFIKLLKHVPWGIKWRVINYYLRFFGTFSFGSINVNIEDAVSLGPDCKLLGDIYLGAGTKINSNVEFIGNISIGRYCSIARHVIFQGRNHFFHKAAIQEKFYIELFKQELGEISKGPIVLGSDVWVGTRAIILSGVNVGHGAIIGAGAVVTNNVEPYSIVAGVSAKHVKWRFPENVRKQLLELRWWDWNKKKIKKNKDFFTSDLTKIDDVYDLVNH